MHCDKLFYICLSKKKPYRAYVVMLLYSTVNKSSMSMSKANESRDADEINCRLNNVISLRDNEPVCRRAN